MNKVSENPSKNRTSRQVHNHTALMIVTALFVTSYLVSNVMAVKVISLFGVVSTHDLLMMILFQYGAKLLIEALFGTPLAYTAVHAIRKRVR